jgi:hypothetical protein
MITWVLPNVRLIVISVLFASKITNEIITDNLTVVQQTYLLVYFIFSHFDLHSLPACKEKNFFSFIFSVRSQKTTLQGVWQPQIMKGEL